MEKHAFYYQEDARCMAQIIQPSGGRLVDGSADAAGFERPRELDSWRGSIGCIFVEDAKGVVMAAVGYWTNVEAEQTEQTEQSHHATEQESREQEAGRREQEAGRREQEAGRREQRGRAPSHTHTHTQRGGRVVAPFSYAIASPRRNSRTIAHASRLHSVATVERRAVARRPPVATPSPRRAVAPRTGWRVLRMLHPLRLAPRPRHSRNAPRLTPHAPRFTRADRAEPPHHRAGGREQRAESRAQRAEQGARPHIYTHTQRGGRVVAPLSYAIASPRRNSRTIAHASRLHSVATVERRAVAHRPPAATPSPRRATAPRTRSRAELGRGEPPRGVGGNI